jgi:pyruvate-ferredoxin/flavodoxin oxidoreductase
MLYNLRQQDMAVKAGHWPLFRHDPRLETGGGNPFRLDSAPPSIPIKDFMASETRFAMLLRSHPETAATLAELAQAVVTRRFAGYQDLAAGHAHEQKSGE